MSRPCGPFNAQRSLLFTRWGENVTQADLMITVTNEMMAHITRRSECGCPWSQFFGRNSKWRKYLQLLISFLDANVVGRQTKTESTVGNMNWKFSCTQMEEDEMSGACSTHRRDEKHIQNLGQNTEAKRPFGRPGSRWNNNIQMHLRETWCRAVGWIHLIKTRWWVLMFRFHKGWGISWSAERLSSSQEGLSVP
jgi:hypothetical protein